ncbi:NAD(P)-binding protein [Daldinia vernicosa]|uniref:NAD(P)-binding protein n=1 Tax=Daldinia vernicosa TaxID=114800 RepID=UPI002007FBDB|nr:NAD(P)-binding protein [Daldinia vernicosa]KAI0844100.1 NAD(P)-binding protein [Daldinia vernicosa]
MVMTFDVSPETRAGLIHYFYRQLFVTPPPVLQRDVNLSGKTAIITGANGGIGLEVARQLLDLGCKVILAVRDESKGEIARKDLTNGRDLVSGFIQVWKLDLSSYDSIIAFAERAKRLESLDIAILNAGIYKVTESFSPTGYEEGVQINFLANMLLTILLLPIIKEKRVGSHPGHICVVSSDTAAWTKFEEGNSTPVLAAFKRKAADWNMADRYGATKLLGQLFLTELAKKVSSSVVTLSCANPGFCSGSELGRETHGIVRVIYKIQTYFLSRSSSIGARTLVHAVTTLGEQAHGQYIEDAKIQPMAVIVYKPEGQRLSKQVYEETLDELSFAGVRDIVNEISKAK